MRISILTIIASIISLIIVWLSAIAVEGGDSNAALMYLVVFAMPIFLLFGVNAVCLYYLRKLKSNGFKLLGAITPVVILLILAFYPQSDFTQNDGPLAFVAKIGSITVGLTNLIWFISETRRKKYRQGENVE
jgi:O-antigen/teichoic acid export membrane protein